MFIANGRDPQGLAKARKQAQANANMSGNDWMVFQDTNSNYHAELHSPTQQGIIEVVRPEKGTTPKKS